MLTNRTLILSESNFVHTKLFFGLEVSRSFRSFETLKIQFRFETDSCVFLFVFPFFVVASKIHVFTSNRIGVERKYDCGSVVNL